MLFGSSLTPPEIIGFALTVLCLLVAWAWPGLLLGYFARVERSFLGLARHPWGAAVAIGLLPLAIRAALLPVYPVPAPSIHDEYGFLLQAQTFASGRLTNPSPPLWPHFESIYILVKPTYTAQYQMAQGLVLAAGKVLTGTPWVGVFCSMGILCALLYWMLRAWVPERWAFLGGVLAGFQLGVFSYWMNSYFGGSIAAIGGTLVLGALPRLRERPRILHAAGAETGCRVGQRGHAARVVGDGDLDGALLRSGEHSLGEGAIGFSRQDDLVDLHPNEITAQVRIIRAPGEDLLGHGAGRIPRSRTHRSGVESSRSP